MAPANTRVVTITHEDTAWHEAFLRYVPRVFPSISFRRWYDLGGWDERYRAFAVVSDDEIVANISLYRMTLVVAGKRLTGWQLGAVGVLPEWRGRGFQSELMPLVLAQAAPGDMTLLFANDTVLDFYPKYGFRRCIERVFGATYRASPERSRLRRLSLESAADVALLYDVAATSEPVSEVFGAIDYGRIVSWYWTNFLPTDLYYAATEPAILVARQDEATLHVMDILAPRPIDLAEWLPQLIASEIDSIEFGFTPERYWPDATPGAEYTDSPLFIRGEWLLPTRPFKFPLLAQT